MGNDIKTDCYWYFIPQDGRYLIRNAQNDEYLAYESDPDNTDKKKIVFKTDITPRCLWDVEVYKGAPRISFTDNTTYVLRLDPTTRIPGLFPESESDFYAKFNFTDNKENTVKLPCSKGFDGYAEQLCFDGIKVVYDTYGERYLFPLPEIVRKRKTYMPNVLFKGIGNASYTVCMEENEEIVPIVCFNNIDTYHTYSMALLRNGEKIASANIEFTNLPIVEVSVDGLNKSTYQEGTLRLLTPSETDLPVHEEVFRSTFRYRGNSSLMYTKKSFNIKLLNSDGGELDTTLLGIRRKDKWILEAMAPDRIKMRNRVCFDIWNEFSKLPFDTEYGNRNGTKGTFVEVVLNGYYNGLYGFSDKIDRSLLNLKKIQDASNGEKTVRGLLYKSTSVEHTGLNIDDIDPSAPMNSILWNNWELTYPDDYPSANTWTPFLELHEVCSSERIKTEFNTYFYPENVLDFHLFVLAYCLIDNGNNNMFFSVRNLQKEKRFAITPWDLDCSLGGNFNGSYWNGNYVDIKIKDLGINFRNPFAKAWQYDIDEYRSRMAARWAAASKTVLSPDSLNHKMERYAALFQRSGAWQREFDRWGAPGGCPMVENLDKEINYIKAFYATHSRKIDEYLNLYNSIRTPHIDANNRRIYRIDGTLMPATPGGRLPDRKGIYIIEGKKYKR